MLFIASLVGLVMVGGMALAGLGDFGEDEGILAGTEEDETLTGPQGDDQICNK